LQQHDYDIIIVGAGVVGLTAALSLASFPLKIALIDSNPLDDKALTNSPNTRVYAINQSSKALWETLGVWPLLQVDALAPYQKMFIWDAANQAHIDFDARLVGQPELGFILAEIAIKKALLQKIQEIGANIDLFPEQKIADVFFNEKRIGIKNPHNSWEADTLLIADGALSPLRQKLKVPLTSWPYHHHAITATIHTERPHSQTAWQVFNPDGPLALLPLKDPHQCSIVWSTNPKHAQQLIDADENFFNQALNKAFGQRLGNLSLRSPRQSFPLIMRHAKQYAGPNWLLLGDAAHTIHPLAGLGLNMGLADVACAASLLKTGRTPQFNKKMLSAYQRERKSDVWQALAIVSSLKTLFANPLPPIPIIRGLGLKLCNHLTPLKRLFIEYANGLKT
jgi:2-octaprenylphenol hydroxylase